MKTLKKKQEVKLKEKKTLKGNKKKEKNRN